MNRKNVEYVKLMDGDKTYIHNNEDARNENGKNYGYFDIKLSDEDLYKLQHNFCIAYNLDGEYVVFLTKK